MLKKMILALLFMLFSVSLVGCSNGAFAAGATVSGNTSGDGIISTDVLFAELDATYQEKLLAFWGYNDATEWKVNGVLQKNPYVNDSTDAEKASSFYYSVGKEKRDYSVSRFSDVSSDNVVFVDGKGKSGLRSDEVILSKGDYYSLYAEKNDVKLSVSDIKSVLDSKDCLAKYEILGYVGMGNVVFRDIEAMSLLYYGILPAAPDKVIELDISSVAGTSHQYKVVGYYETERDAEVLRLIGEEIDLSEVKVITGMADSGLSESDKTETMNKYYSKLAAVQDKAFFAKTI